MRHRRVLTITLLCSIVTLSAMRSIAAAQPIPAQLRLSSFTTSSIEDDSPEDETYALIYVLSPDFRSNVYRFGPHSLRVNQSVSLTGVVLQNCVAGQSCWGPWTAENPPLVIAALMESDSEDQEHIRTSLLQHMVDEANNTVSMSPQERSDYLVAVMTDDLRIRLGNISPDHTDDDLFGTPQAVTFSAADLEDAPIDGPQGRELRFGAYRAVFEIQSVVTAADPYLANANIRFHTNDDDKDENTHVTVTLRDSSGAVLGEISDFIGKLNDGSDTGPMNFLMSATSSAASARAGTVSIHVDPVGDDTWHFDYQLETAYSDGSVTTRFIPGIELTEDSRDAAFSIAPPPPPPPAPRCQVDSECVQDCVLEGCEPPSRPSDCLRRCRRLCCT